MIPWPCLLFLFLQYWCDGSTRTHTYMLSCFVWVEPRVLWVVHASIVQIPWVNQQSWDVGWFWEFVGPVNRRSKFRPHQCCVWTECLQAADCRRRPFVVVHQTKENDKVPVIMSKYGKKSCCLKYPPDQTGTLQRDDSVAVFFNLYLTW